MKKIYLLIILLGTVSSAAFSQINYGVVYDPHFNTHGARYFPSRLGATFNKGEVNFINIYGWGSNNAIGYQYIKDIALGDEITTDQAKAIVSRLKNNNNIFVGADLQILNAAFKIKDKEKKKELFSMEIGHRERVMGNVQFSKNIMKLMLEGNKQFANQTIALGDIRANALYSREFYIGAAVPVDVTIAGHDLKFRAGAKAKFLMGIANVFTKRGKADMFTETDGRYIDFNYDYKLSHSIPDNLSALGSGNGLGGGADLGLGVVIDDNICVDLGLIDIGAIRFTKNTQNYLRKGAYRYDGVEMSLLTEDGQPSVGFDFNENVLDPEKTEKAYVTPYGTKFTLRAEYRMKKSRSSKRDTTKTYFQHHFYLTYVQGFNYLYTATKVPNFSFGYMYSLKDILNVGMSFSFLGYNKFALGPFLSVKGGPFVIGFGSNNLMAFMAPKFGTGADAYFNLGFNF